MKAYLVKEGEELSFTVVFAKSLAEAVVKYDEIGDPLSSEWYKIKNLYDYLNGIMVQNFQAKSKNGVISFKGFLCEHGTITTKDLVTKQISQKKLIKALQNAYGA